MSANAVAGINEYPAIAATEQEFVPTPGREELVPFPTIAYQDQPGAWRVTLRGAIYEPEIVTLQKRLLVRLLQRVMKAPPTEFEGDWFRRRVRYFVARTDRGSRVAATIGRRRVILPKKTRRNGQFRGVIRLDDNELQKLKDEGVVRDGCLHVPLASLDGQAECTARVRLVPPRGWSVISDIDDTIKQTTVTNRRELLANTFVRPFRAVEGMSEVYRKWEGQVGAQFHYVSSSPWQLLTDLTELVATNGFPDGSFHLRSFRLRDHMLRRVMLIRRGGKGAAIRQLLEALPQRQFVLVGDSGEVDAELYAAAARRFPRQVVGILIRQLPERPIDLGRANRVFRDLPRRRWHLADSAAELSQWTGWDAR